MSNAERRGIQLPVETLRLGTISLICWRMLRSLFIRRKPIFRGSRTGGAAEDPFSHSAYGRVMLYP
jgi:hypothetical protein